MLVVVVVNIYGYIIFYSSNNNITQQREDIPKNPTNSVKFSISTEVCTT